MAVGDLPARFQDSEFGSYRLGGGGMVAGDKDRGDSCVLAGADGGRCGGTGRVLNRDQAEQAQVSFQVAEIRRKVLAVGLRDCEDAETGLGEPIRLRRRVGVCSVGEQRLTQYGLRRAFAYHPAPARR